MQSLKDKIEFLVFLPSRHLLNYKRNYRRDGAEGHDTEAKTDGWSRFLRNHINQKSGANANKKNYFKAHNRLPAGVRLWFQGG